MLKKKEGKMRYSKELCKLLLPNTRIESSYGRILSLEVEVRVSMFEFHNKNLNIQHALMQA